MFNVTALLLDDALLKCVVTEVFLFSVVDFLGHPVDVVQNFRDADAADDSEHLVLETTCTDTMPASHNAEETKDVADRPSLPDNSENVITFSFASASRAYISVYIFCKRSSKNSTITSISSYMHATLHWLTYIHVMFANCWHPRF